MAFLDNSGDIILDAVLTDLGRKRMAEGNFRITQFALGDDEIDYSLYNKDHPSGSAYYDLQILQTPVFEAFTRENSNINYGLLTYDGNNELLYLPKIVLNQKRTYNTSTIQLTNGIVYLAVNDETYSYLNGGGGGLGPAKVAAENVASNYFSFETGIDNDNDPAGTAQERKDYIVNSGLLDNEINLTCDNRFLTSVLPIRTTTALLPGTIGPGLSSTAFGYPSGGDIDVRVAIAPKPLTAIAGTSYQQEMLDYTVPTVPNLVTDQGSKTTTGITATDVSEINGPRGVFTAFNFGVAADLKTTAAGTVPRKFALYGRTSVAHGDLPGISAGTFDIIDTVVYLRGNTTGANTQLIVRLIRKAV